MITVLIEKGKNVISWQFWLILLSVNAFSPAQMAATMPSVYFGDNLALLIPTHQAILAPLELSPSGSFVAGIEPTEERAYVHLWETQAAVQASGVSRPVPTYTFSLNLPSTGRPYAESLVFSPSESYLAILLGSQVFLLTLPELELYKTLSPDKSNYPGEIAWSADGSFLSITLSDEVVVWNTGTDEMYQHDLEYVYDELESFGTEWLLWVYSHTRNPNDFVICTQLLEQCNPYTSPGIVRATSPVRQMILTQGRQEGGLVTGIWARQEDGVYAFDDTVFDELEGQFFPMKFSPSGRYIAASGADGRTTIWNFDTLTPIQLLPEQLDPVWVFNDELFVTWWTLYTLGEDEPLDVLDLDTTPGLEDIQDYMISDMAGIHSAVTDGRWVLHRLGRAGLLIPLIHQ